MAERKPVWVTVHIAPTGDEAQRIQAALTGEGFMARIQPVSADVTGAWEVQCIPSEAAEALGVIHHTSLHS